MKLASTFRPAWLLLAALLIAGCASTAPAPTAAPAAPTKAPAAAPTSAPAATKAPAAAPTTVPAAPTAAPAKKVDFPVAGRTITMIVPYAPGGATDLAGRVVAQGFQQDFGVNTAVVNKAGATGVIGSTELANSKPDGYTVGVLSVSSIGSMFVDPTQKLPINRKSFEMVAMYSVDPCMLMVKADSPIKDGKDLIDRAKANPGKISISTSGLLGTGHLAAAAVEKAAGVTFNYVHTTGAAPAVTALLGGHVDVSVSSLGASVAAPLRGNQARIIGMIDKNRSPYYPDAKTFAEFGYPADFPLVVGIGAPAGTPPELVNILSGSIKKTLASDTIKKQLAEQLNTAGYMSPAESNTYWEKLEASIKEMGDFVRSRAK